MAQQKKGFIARMLEGKERSEEYARSTLPTNRWQLFWDIFKGNFGKMVKINLLTLLFFIPTLFVIIVGLLVNENNGLLYPFASNLGVGYPVAPNQQGVAEYLIFSNEILIYGMILLTMLLASVGLAGGMYVMRNMVWTEGVFVANDFWRGVKLNYKNALQTSLFFCVILFLTNTMGNMAALTKATAVLSTFETVMLTISEILSYTMLIIALLMSFWMIALGVNYKMSFWVMLKNSFLIAIGTLPQSVFFIALALLPFVLFLFNVQLFTVLAVFIVILFALSYALLVWLDFAQWVFDKYINPKIAGAKVGRGIYTGNTGEASDEDNSAATIEYERVIIAAGKSQLVARPIKPIDDDLAVYQLPTAYTREDLKRLRESKQVIQEDTEAYEEEHKNDARYVDYNRQFDERQRALLEHDAANDKKKKKKKPKILDDKK